VGLHPEPHHYRCDVPRVLVSTVAGLAALASAGVASAAYDPSLLVGDSNPALGAKGPVRVFLRTRQFDEATAVVTVYAPRGYGVDLNHAPGTQLGRFVAEVRTRAVGGALQTVEGAIRSDDPAKHVNDQCAPGAHEAVWLLEFRLAGGTFRLPVYVDRMTTPYASARMVICHAPADLTAPEVAMPYADLTIGNVFTNPAQQGTYAWNAVFVPYRPGTATLDPASTAQSTAYVNLPSTFAVTAKRQRGRFAVVRACLREAGEALRGLALTFYYGGKSVFGSRRVATRLTDAAGCATTRIRLRKTRLVFASVHAPVRRGVECAPTLAPRCSEGSISPPPVVFRTVRVRG
jgi:hypothetical protein